MIRKIVGYLMLLIITIGVSKVDAQPLKLEDFQALQSYGQIPEDFLNSQRNIIHSLQPRQDSDSSRKDFRTHEKFEVMSNYYLNEMLSSGEVVFGDPIGNYINKVADNLLASFPDLRKQLRFYVTKSVAANAYSTDHGIIFVNVGLISRLKNEAQLAFILAHEIVHYVNKHNINIFIEKQKAYSRRSSRTEYSDLSLSDRLLRVNGHSKEIETLADHDAFALYYSKSQYDAGQAEEVFDALLYSAYPFTNDPFDLSLLENATMIIPDYYLVDDVEKLKVDENEADSISTHPNVRKRKNVIRKLIDSIPQSGTDKFILGQSEFYNVVSLAKFEVLRQLIIKHRLIEVLFCSASMIHDYPDNVFVKKCLAASLYGISCYKSSGEASDIVKSYSDVAGEMAQVNYMVSRLNRRDMNILALNYVWRLHQEIPNDVYISEISDDLFNTLVSKISIKQSYFYDKSLAELKLDRAKTPEIPDTIATNTRYRKKKAAKSSIDTTFTKFAFVDLMKNPAFTDEFEKWVEKAEAAEAAEKAKYEHDSPSSASAGDTKKKKDRVYIRRIVMSEPYMIKVDTRNRDEVKYAESAVGSVVVKKLLKENAKAAKINMHIASMDSINSESVNKYNEMCFINEYVSERFNQTTDGIMQSFCKLSIDTIMQKNNTAYLGWMGISSFQEKKPIFKLCVLSIFPYMWPYTIYQFATPKIHSSYYHVLFNVKSGKIVVAGSTQIRTDLHKDQMNAHIYDFMYKIHKCYE